MTKKEIIILIIAIIIIALGIGGYFYWEKSKTVPQEQILQTVGQTSDILKKSATQGVLPSVSPNINPLKNAPDINPVTKTNPFTNIKTNPF